MVFNVLLLVIQISLLLLVVLRESFRPGKKNLIAIIFFTAHLVLVQGQALYVLHDLALNSEPVFYASNVITFRSFTYANVVLTLSVGVIFASFHLSKKKVVRTGGAGPAGPQESLFSYIVVAGIVAFSCAMLVSKLGGLRHFYYSMGVMVGGQVVLMILLSVGKLPLFCKVASQRKPNLVDWLLLLVAGFMIMLNSRGTAIFVATQYLLLGYFCNPRGGRAGRTFLKLGVVFFLVVIVYGGIRDFVTPRRTFDGMVEYYFESRGPEPARAMNMGDMFFRFMVGPFTGLAGILNTEIQAGVEHDYGVSNLCLLTHLVPYRLRIELLGDIDSWLCSLTAVSGSVVPGGYESSFIHLGLAGVFLFAVCIGAFPSLLHAGLVSSRPDKLKYTLVSVQVLNFLLVPLWCVVFWVLAELGTVWLYRLVLSAGMSLEHRGRPAACLEPAR